MYPSITPTALRKLPALAVLATLLQLFIAAPASAADTLGTNQTLYANQSLTSQNGAYTLIVQLDGNLVLYGPSGALWATNTGGSNARLVMQLDGNLVLYRGDGAVLWATNRFGINARLVVQNDSNLVVYNGWGGVIWSRY